MSNILRFLTALLTLPFFTTAQTVDTVPPQVKCKVLPYLTGCGPTGQVWFKGGELIESVSDDISPASSITLAVRKKCTGEGFPEGKEYLIVGVSEMWDVASYEVWAKDQAGNTSFCQSQVYVSDAGWGFCEPGLLGRVLFPKDSSKIENTLLHTVQFTCQGDTVREQRPIPIHYSFGSLSRPGDLLWATPSKTDHPLNGVSTYDLVLISKHILGLSKLSAAQLIAADANRDGKVTTYDVVLLRQLILGIIPELPGGVSWRFWPYDYAFPDPDNPFAPPFPERIEVPRSADPATNNFWFFGVKIGDVNYSAEVK